MGVRSQHLTLRKFYENLDEGNPSRLGVKENSFSFLNQPDEVGEKTRKCPNTKT